MLVEISFQNVVLFFSGIVAIITAVVMLYKYLVNTHDQVQKWNGYDEQIVDIKRSIQDTKTDYTAKMQEIRAEQHIQSKTLLAILDGLHQLKCNGKTTEAENELKDFLNEKAHQQ